MDAEQYIKECWDKAAIFINGIKSGEILSNEDIKFAVEYFDREVELVKNDSYQWIYSFNRVNLVFEFFANLYIQQDEDHPDLIQFPLCAWQCFVILFFYGFYDRITLAQRYRTLFILIGRKNGKTTFSFALQLFNLALSDAIDPQCLFIAQNGDSAKQLLNIAKRIIYNSPMLDSDLEIMSKTIKFKKSLKNLGYLAIKVHKPDVLHGTSPSFTILDEIHTYKDDGIYNALTSGQGGRKNPLVILSTSGGNKNAIFCNEKIKYSKALLRGKIKNERFLPFLFSLDDGDNYEDQSLWIKSNPSMHDFPYLKEWLPTEFEEKKYSASGLREFLTYNLNLFIDQKTVWLTEKQIDSLFADIKIEDYKNYDAYLGLDLSAVYDLTALIVLLRHKDTGKFIFIPFLFMAKNPSIFKRRDGNDLGQWAEQGHIHFATTTSSDKLVIDYDVILDKIKELKGFFNIKELCYDNKLSYQIISKINNDLGIKNTQPFDHNRENYDRLIDDFEYLMNKDSIVIQRNPAVKWNFTNSKLEYDNRFLKKISRKSSEESIDAAVAVLYAMQAYYYWAMPQYTKKIA
jgi:phage terminase large subunit-like protein